MIKVNFAGQNILKAGYYGCPWWDKLIRTLRYHKNYSEDQIVAFFKLNDTFIRLDMHEPGFWKDDNYVKQK